MGGGSWRGVEKQNSADDIKNAKLSMFRVNADRVQYGFQSKVYYLAKLMSKALNEMGEICILRYFAQVS